MDGLNELLLQCDKNALVVVVKNLCVMFQEKMELYLDDPEENDLGFDSEDVKVVVRYSLLKMKMAAKSQQDKDQNAFTVVLGAGMAAGKPDYQLAKAGGRARAPTGPLVVGGDALSFISTFLSWNKVKLQREWKAPGDGVVDACDISPCSSTILTSSGDDLHLWNAASGMLKSTLKGHADEVMSCRFFPDGKTVVSASMDCTLKVWDVATGSLVRTLVDHTDTVRCIDVSPDNARILSSSLDESWTMWNSRTGDLQHTEQTNAASCCCSFSPNGSLFLVGCGANLRLYRFRTRFSTSLHDPMTYQQQRTFTGHGDVCSQFLLLCSRWHHYCEWLVRPHDKTVVHHFRAVPSNLLRALWGSSCLLLSSQWP
jgi:WD40 repeat protein